MRKPHVGIWVALTLAVAVSLPSTVAARPGDQRPQDRILRASVTRVRIVDDRFRPRSITVARGTRVRWINRGNHTHTTTSDDGVWDSGLLSAGNSFSRRFRTRGTFEYLCTVHPSMTATITVA